jgi:hypothetical protein
MSESNNEFMREVEINGIKMQIDLRQAKRIDTFKVGDSVKILKKGSSSSSYDKDDKIYPGMIVDFANFKELPTLVVAYYEEGGWSSPPTIQFLYFNANTEGWDLVYCDENELAVSEQSILQLFDRKIGEKQKELDDLVNKKEYFITHFMKGKAFPATEKEEA